MKTCWCGNAELLSFSNEYGECRACGTLVSLDGMTTEQLQVHDDDTDFYGKKYWLNHQNDDLGFPDINGRARNDLTERNLHWLKALLKYRLAPAKVLELGCSHGGFVALLRLAGYDSSGVEMSPWVVEFGQKTFGIPVAVGPVETLDIADGSLDVIALMDVLEHLPDPAATMAHCLKLLKPDGLLLIQTPQFKHRMNFAQLLEIKGAFLEQLKADEHLYLFTDDSARYLFQRLGAEHVQFEPALFDQYDMFFAVSRMPFRTNSPAQVDANLLARPDGRLALALLDLRQRELDLAQKWQAADADRSARGEQVVTLTAMLTEVDSDRAARGAQIETLAKMLAESDGDRAARGVQIETLAKMLAESDSDRAARAVQIETLSKMLNESEGDRAARGEQIDILATMLKESDIDRAARGTQIETLTTMLKESEADRLVRGERIEALLAGPGKPDAARTG